MVFAIDPGNEQSAYVLMNGWIPVEFKKDRNDAVLARMVSACRQQDIDLVIENIACYGMPVGRQVFDTAIWIGRYVQAARDAGYQKNVEYVYRKEEKVYICGSMRAKDANIRQALINRFAGFDFKNGKGTKAKPDIFYGFRADIWAAYAVGVTYLFRLQDGVSEGAQNGNNGG